MQKGEKMSDIKSFIEKVLFTKNRKIDSNRIKESWLLSHGYEEQYKEILSGDGTTITQKIYNLYYGTSTPLCKHCSVKPVKFKNFQEGYVEYCSCKCSANSAEKQNKIMHTNILKFGETSPIKNKDIIEKCKRTNIERYGVEWTLQSETVKTKIKNTNLKKYGVSNSKQKHISDDSLNKLNDKEWILDEHYNKEKTITQIAKEINVTKRTVLNYLSVHGIEAKRFTVSSGEKEIFDFLSQYTEVETNKRNIINPQEIDLYLPEYNLAIEYNGLYWHTEELKPKSYHLNKTLKCAEKGIQLIHVFEDEWINKPDVVKSVLLSKLGIYSKKIPARKCTVIKQNNKEVRDFIENNHLQGNTKAKDYYCLYFNDELVSVASVGKSRFDKDCYELIRFCTKQNYIVNGGFSKILNRIKIDYKMLYSYTDLRYFSGNIYSNFGTFLKRTDPGYYWTDSTVRITRYRTQRKNICNVLGDEYDPSLSESQNMRNAGYYKIYDCGHDLYLL